MSLLDDVSIVVTPNGYKAGELYAVIPVPTEGAEEITNGDFATDTDWTKGTGWTISGGTANCNNTSGSTQNLQTENKILNLGGKRVQISFTVSNYSGSASMTVTLQGTGGNDFSGINANGTYTTLSLISPTDNSIDLLFKASNGWVGSIDNVSVKEYTSADMDVTRATAATRVDEDGLVNYAEVIGDELVTCGDFSCATPSTYWTATNAVVSFSNNQITVDDTASAGGDSRATQNFPTISGRVYRVKINRISTTTTFWLSIGNGSSFNNIKYLNLGTDTGEYTTEFTATGLSSTIALQVGGSGVSVFSDVTVKEVTRDNVPRIDYTGGGCPHILAEPQRTNLYPYSNDTTTWGKSNFTATNNYAISPDGTQNAFRGVSTSNASLLYIGSTGSAGTNTISIYAKSNTASDQKFRFFGNGNTTQSTDQTATQEWQRFEYTATYSFITWGLLGASVSGTNDILFYGMQHEVGSYPTSYIPTSGSTVTRNQDIFTRDGIGSLINSTEGVLFVEFKTLYETGVFRQFNLSKDNSNRIYITKRGDNGNLECRMENPAGNLNFSFAKNTTNDFVKVAFRYGLNNFAVFIDGVNQNVTATGNVFASGTLNTLEFDSPLAQPFFGKVKQLQVYNTALTDEQLTSLTT